jgi:alanine racemase
VVDLDALTGNIRGFQQAVGKNAEVMAVVKANAYGHGVLQVAQTALAAGVTRLAIAIVEEGVSLRKAGILVPILILGVTPPSQADVAVKYSLTATVSSMVEAEAFSRAAVVQGKPVRLHLKIDTGMGRLGVAPDEAVGLAQAIALLPLVELEGVFTHFACADEICNPLNTKQEEQFSAVVRALRGAGLAVKAHAANTATILTRPAMHWDIVRVGIGMYGYYPSEEVREAYPGLLRPVLSLVSRLSFVKEVPAGTSLSYGATFTTRTCSRVGTVPIGYADGLSRRLSNSGHMIVRGVKVPIVGRICMDQCMVLLDEVPDADVGDDVVIYGHQGSARVSVDEVADQLGTISYEILCAINQRVPRVYTSRGEIVSVLGEVFE